MTHDFGATVAFHFSYPATIDYVYDGDTFHAHVRITPGLAVHSARIRVQDLKAPELAAPGGAESKAYAATLLPPGTAVVLGSKMADKYGRFLLATVALPDGSDFATRMVDTGHATWGQTAGLLYA